jgi:hypothetical protein
VQRVAASADSTLMNRAAVSLRRRLMAMPIGSICRFGNRSKNHDGMRGLTASFLAIRFKKSAVLLTSGKPHPFRHFMAQHIEIT